MDVKPLRRYPTPHYPTVLQVGQYPALLSKLPLRCAAERLGVAAALLAVLGGASGCGVGTPGGAPIPVPTPAGAPPMPVSTSVPTPTDSPAHTPTATPSSTPEIAGGIMAAPMLNEDDVRSILRNEAARLDAAPPYELDEDVRASFRQFVDWLREEGVL